jgi:hypothetical protein
MRNTVRAALAALSLTTAALIASPAAQAFTDGDPASHYGGGHLGDQDGSAYATQLNVVQAVFQAKGFTPAKATDFGQGLCSELVSETEDQIVEQMVHHVPTHMARAMLHGAEFHFCPAYFGGKEA